MDSKELVKNTILFRLEFYKNGWWHGWDDLEENITFDLGSSPPVKELRKLMQELKKEGKVEARPIWGETSGLLNGKGWFKLC